MEKEQIQERVYSVVDNWISLQEKRNVSVSITEKAKDFLVEVINNIVEDPSAHWRSKNFDQNAAQELAISLIPNALHDIYPFRRHNISAKGKDINISSWEIWHALSYILDRWCFIPKDV